MPVGAVERNAIQSVDLRCPADAPDAAALQAYASSIASRLETPINLRRIAPVAPSRRVEFTYDGQHWTLPGPARFISSFPEYPERAVMRGLDARCDLAVTLGDDARTRETEVVCQAFRSNGRPTRSTLFDRPAIDVIEGARWLVPPDTSNRCATTYLTFALGGELDAERPWLERPVEGAPTCPKD